MSDTPSAYARALLVELQAHPSRGPAIHAELQREGWYVDDNGALAKVKESRKERADAEPAPENTAQLTPARRTRKPSDAEDSDAEDSDAEDSDAEDSDAEDSE